LESDELDSYDGQLLRSEQEVLRVAIVTVAAQQGSNILIDRISGSNQLSRRRFKPIEKLWWTWR
jgi:hypothetical protein